MNYRILFILPLVLGLIAGCKKDDDDDSDSPGFDQSELLRNWGEQIIVPAYADYADRVGQLKNLSDALNEQSSIADVDAVKNAYSSAYVQWQRIAHLEIGPAEALILKTNTNIFPCDTPGTNVKIAAGDVDFSSASDLDKKGFPAIDYLLFGPISMLENKRLTYLKALVKDLDGNAKSVNDSWENYLQSFTGATGNDVGSSLGMMINAMTKHMEANHREGKIGIPNGERSFSGDPLPAHVEGFYENSNSLNYGRENLLALKKVYLGEAWDGTDGYGLEEALNGLGARYNGGTLDAAIQAQFEVCFTAYDQISVPMSEAVTQQRDEVSALYKEIQKLVVLFKADIPSSMGVLITYQDNDGD